MLTEVEVQLRSPQKKLVYFLLVYKERFHHVFRQTHDVLVERLCTSIALLVCKCTSNGDALLNPALSPLHANEQATQCRTCIAA